MKIKKQNMWVVLCIMVVTMCNGMELQRTLSKESKVRITDLLFPLEPIDPQKIEAGTIVLWKKNESHFYKVLFGGRLADTSSYKVYQAENAGIVCSASELYRYKQIH
jgi:hypothetical protein